MEMDFSQYRKALVYVLTFLAYAWSGYGAGLLSNLRDAVLATESVFQDFFQNAITVANKIKDIHEVFDAAVEENCIFQCPGGTRFNLTDLYKFYLILDTNATLRNLRNPPTIGQYLGRDSNVIMPTGMHACTKLNVYFVLHYTNTILYCAVRTRIKFIFSNNFFPQCL